MKNPLKRNLFGVTSLIAIRNILPAAFVIIVTLSGCLDGSNSSGNSQKFSPLGIEVTLDSGVVLGREHPESDVWEWLGIPFAQPPVGDLRWRAPQPVNAWKGVREATEFGTPCLQPAGADSAASPDAVIGDEDCL